MVVGKLTDCTDYNAALRRLRALPGVKVGASYAA